MRPADQIVLPGRYLVSPRTLCFIFRKGYVLLLRGAADKRIWPSLLNGIGGHVEPGEDVLSAARREIGEEAGLVVEDLHLCGIVNAPAASGQGVMLFVFKARTEQLAVRASQEGSPEWVPCDDLPTDELVPDLPMLLPRVVEHSPCRPPFYAVYRYGTDGSLRIEFAGEPSADASDGM